MFFRIICHSVHPIQSGVGSCTEGGHHLPSTFKLVGYEARTVGKRSIGIRLKCLLVTVHKRSLRRLCFYTSLSVILFTGGVPGQVPPRQVSLGRYPLPRLVHSPRQVHPPRQVHLPPGRYTPPGQVQPARVGTPHGHSGCWDTVNKRAVRIPLECILVHVNVYKPEKLRVNVIC